MVLGFQVQGHHLTQRAVLIKQDSGQILMIHQPRSWAILESFYSSCDLRLLSAPIWVATKNTLTFWRYCGVLPHDKKQLPHAGRNHERQPCIHMPPLRSERSPGSHGISTWKNTIGFMLNTYVFLRKVKKENLKNHLGILVAFIHAPTYVPIVCISNISVGCFMWIHIWFFSMRGILGSMYGGPTWLCLLDWKTATFQVNSQA